MLCPIHYSELTSKCQKKDCIFNSFYLNKGCSIIHKLTKFPGKPKLPYNVVSTITGKTEKDVRRADTIVTVLLRILNIMDFYFDKCTTKNTVDIQWNKIFLCKKCGRINETNTNICDCNDNDIYVQRNDLQFNRLKKIDNLKDTTSSNINHKHYFTNVLVNLEIEGMFYKDVAFGYMLYNYFKYYKNSPLTKRTVLLLSKNELDIASKYFLNDIKGV
jgi:hypothetical protein